MYQIFQGFVIDRFRESQMHGKHGICLSYAVDEQNRVVIDLWII